MKLNILKINSTLFCLKCGILSVPSSSSNKTMCTFRTIAQNSLKHRQFLKNVSMKFWSNERRTASNMVQKNRASMNILEVVKSFSQGDQKIWRNFKFMFSSAYNYKGRIIAGISLLGITSSIFLSIPGILGKLLDDDNADKSNDDVFAKGARYFKKHPWALLAFLSFGAVCMGIRIYLVTTAAQLVINDVRSKVFRSLMRKDMSFFDHKTNSVGELSSRLSSDVAIIGTSVSINLMDGTRCFIGAIGATGLAIYASPSLCIAGAVMGPLVIGVIALSSILSAKYSQQMQDAIANSNQVAVERLTNIKTVRTLVTEEKEIETYKDRIQQIWVVAQKEGILRGTVAGLMMVTTYGGLAGILFYGSGLISQGLLTFGDLASFSFYAFISIYNILDIQRFFADLMKGLGASNRLAELSAEAPKIPLCGGIQINDVKREISFQSVAFAYQDSPLLFNDITFRIPAGKVTAIVGPSGSGKSTLANLLLRLYDPSQGRIVIDEHDLRDLDPSHWRRMIGTVSQEPVLFTTSIKKNIAYAAENPEQITDEQIEEATRQANCWDFIKRKPQGFETLVGDSGSTGLSGGEKQRIAIARAWLMNPRVLIMDEATSALDAESEYFIRLALRSLLKRRQQTVVIIAHRLSTIKHADQIVVLDKGRIAELGDYDELMSKDDGIFKKLVEKQAIGWREDKF